MLLHSLSQVLKGALIALVNLPLILLWMSDYSLTTKALGSVGLLLLAGLVGWGGAAFGARLKKRRMF
ncbi:hypothetical protein CHX26_09930 [Porphyrobacter sp. HT-58-2]|uniref:hypothetical protein n=1 Tax=Porphyrobacter sp. HT-58-2 TaxID=2023229 RepID=UPI000CDC0273|nr:hypothetical protein [Porphyrobacter sp. HT-58-2]AUX69772.1 hypothetical protein CHX26_09930 [Porphyrobacter sp. HT-58-2]